MSDTELDLDAIQGREERATHGPWTIEYSERNHQSPAVLWMGRGEQLATDIYEIDELIEDNAEFIAHARTDVPALIAEIRRLRWALDASYVTSIEVIEACACDPDSKHERCELHVSCDYDCRALRTPVTPDELRAAVEHWFEHSWCAGCSHGA